MSGFARVEEPLTDGVVALRSPTDDDIDVLIAGLNDPAIARWVNVPQPYTREHAERYLAMMEERRRAGRELGLVTTDAATGEVLGTHNLRVTSSEHRRGEVGAAFFTGARGRGFGSASARVLARHAFEELGIARIDAIFETENPAPREVAVKAGYAREAVLRSYVERGGRRVDMELWSLIPEDLGL